MSHNDGVVHVIPASRTGGGLPGVVQPNTTDADVSSVTASPDINSTQTLAGLGGLITFDLQGRQGCGIEIASGITGSGTITCKVRKGVSPSFQNSYFITPDGQLRDTLLTSDLPFRGSIWVPSGTTRVQVLSGSNSNSSTVYFSATQAWTVVAIPLPTAGQLITFGGKVVGNPITQPTQRMGGRPVTLRVAGSFTPPQVTATVPPQTVLTFSPIKFQLGTQDPKGFIIDECQVSVLSPGVSSSLNARLMRRYIMYRSLQTAAPAAGAVPTGAALAYTGAPNGGGTYQYKYVAVDMWGNEGNLSGASLNVAPAANNGVTVTCPAVPAGAKGYNIYRTLTGPGATFYLCGRTNTTTFRDIQSDTNIFNNGITTGQIATWGTLPNVDSPASGALELIMEKAVALAAGPTIMEVVSYPQRFFGGGIALSRLVTIAPGTAVGRYRIPGDNEAVGLNAFSLVNMLGRDIDQRYDYNATGVQQKDQILAAFGDIEVRGFNIADSAIGGSFVVWGEELLSKLYPSNVPVNADTTLSMMNGPIYIGPTDEIVIEVGSGAAAVAQTIEVYLSGRLFD